ncbi:MAG: hypothetical protein ABSF34_15170, partial [Verrucomicrobiota bacterium]
PRRSLGPVGINQFAWRTWKHAGSSGLIALVKLKLPLAFIILVATGVHWFNAVDLYEHNYY